MSGGAYLFRGALLCEFCGEHKCKRLAAVGAADSGDSDDFPQGPFEEGGGEADSPQHCDECGEFLHNPLTAEGAAYVAALRPIPAQWGDEYAPAWPSIAEAMQ